MYCILTYIFEVVYDVHIVSLCDLEGMLGI